MHFSDLDLKPTDRKLRQFAVLLAVIGAALAVWRYSGGRSVIVPAAAAAIGVLGAAWPAVARPVYVALTVATFPIGWVVSRLLLGVVFYAVFTPVALIFRMIGRDALRLRPTEEESYWTPKKQSASKAHYMRQF